MPIIHYKGTPYEISDEAQAALGACYPDVADGTCTTEEATEAILRAEGLLPSRLTTCPICDGELQGAVEKYFSAVTVAIGATGQPTILCSQDDGMGDDVRIYCENDHGWDEMATALEAREAQRTGRLRGCQSTNHKTCDLNGLLWQCGKCGKNVCTAEGSDNDIELCDDCWAKKHDGATCAL